VANPPPTDDSPITQNAPEAGQSAVNGKLILTTSTFLCLEADWDRFETVCAHFERCVGWAGSTSTSDINHHTLSSVITPNQSAKISKL